MKKFVIYSSTAAVAIGLLAFATPALAATINVPGDYATIPAAINAANPGDTVQVAAGSYAMGGYTITKSIDLEGPNAGVNPITGTRGSEAVIDGYFNLQSGISNVTINGFKFVQNTSTNWARIQMQGSASDVAIKDNIISNVVKHGIYSGWGMTLSHVLIQGNLIDGVTGTNMSGIFAFGNYENGSVISGNKIENVAVSGINTAGATDLAISNNTISNTGSQGIQVNSATGNVSVTGNTITNANTGHAFDGGGIRLYTGTAGSVAITGNTVSGSYNGISVRDGIDITGNDITVSDNNVAGNSNAGVYNGAATGLLVATNNWWGSTTGPTDTVSGDGSIPDTNPGGTGAAALGAIEYGNWCANASCSASGVITSPTDGSTVSGTVDFTAAYNDGDVPNSDDGVQWAVRQGTCAAGTGTVAGNVDGYHDVASWDGNSFSYTADTSSWATGSYCFIFNPVDDPGQPNVRVTSTFTVAPPVPTTKAECMKGGWETYADSSYDHFKNQGDCVSFVATGGKNMAAGN